MLRRNFLRQLGAAIATVTTVGAATTVGCCPDPACRKTVMTVTLRRYGARTLVAEVTGPKEELRELVDVFQTKLWRQWRDDDSKAGRDVRKRMEAAYIEIQKNGKILCDVSYPVSVAAFCDALPDRRKNIHSTARSAFRLMARSETNGKFA